MVSWPEIQAGIFAGESGGDYGALYGYSNRPGGAFEGVNLQDMTVGQVADFTSPSGPYGQWVKGQVGRVATPVGAYQVVGTTLRDAIKAGAVDPSQPFNRETQDRLGKWIYETQGTGAWEGYRGPQPSGSQPVQVSRGQPMERNMPSPQEQQQPRRNMADVRDRLILALEGMTLNPNQGLMQVAASGLQERAEGRKTTQSQNRTAEWLRSQGRDDLAQAVMAGALGGREAAALAYQQPSDDRTALQRNYEFFISQGMSPEDAMQAVRSGTTVNVDTRASADEAFFKDFGKGDADALISASNAGIGAQRNLVRLNELEERLSNAPQGIGGAITALAGDLGIPMEGVDEVQAARAIINSMVPEQRAPGSGPMSDADLALFKQSLPRIINQPGGNAAIIGALRRINEYDMKGAEIVQRLRMGDITRAQAMAELQSRPDPLSGLPIGAPMVTPDAQKYLE